MILQKMKVKIRLILNSSIKEIKMASRNHVHRYILRDIGTKVKSRKVYACSFADCSHYLPSSKLAIGKNSICWKCGGKFVLGYDQIRVETKKPKCPDCRASFKSNLPHLKKREEEIKKSDDALDLLLKMRNL